MMYYFKPLPIPSVRKSFACLQMASVIMSRVMHGPLDKLGDRGLGLKYKSGRGGVLAGRLVL